MKIAIISSSVRQGRNSHRVALFFQEYIRRQQLAEVDLLDLNEYQFPLFEERLQYMKEHSQQVLDFAGRIENADGVLIITPEYNGGYPASLKNVIDLLYPQWKRKPIAIASVSSGPFGASQVLTALTFTLWKIGALLVPALFQVAKITDSYQEDGQPTNPADTERRADTFLKELIWCMKACEKMDV